MAQNSKIEWTDHTVNFWHGCTKVHAGCDNCYAEKLANRFGTEWGEGVPRKRIKSAFKDLAMYQKRAAKEGVNYKIFCGSMMDIFEKSKPLSNPAFNLQETAHLRASFFNHIPQVYPNLTFLMLTKRPSNINKYTPFPWKEQPPENVVFGCSPVDQPTYDTFIRQMAKVNGKKFLSIEPQLGHINLHSTEGIDWIIQGGESGTNKRPFKLEWADSMREQCKALNIPYFFKQIDKVQEIPPSYLIRETPF
jgi:protein gp37